MDFLATTRHHFNVDERSPPRRDRASSSQGPQQRAQATAGAQQRQRTRSREPRAQRRQAQGTSSWTSWTQATWTTDTTEQDPWQSWQEPITRSWRTADTQWHSTSASTGGWRGAERGRRQDTAAWDEPDWQTGYYVAQARWNTTSWRSASRTTQKGKRKGR